MLFLTFSIGGDTFGLNAGLVREVVPLPAFKALPRSPDYVAGLFNYRGSIVPVIDLCRLATDKSCLNRMSSRVIVVDYPAADGDVRPLGLLAEKVTQAVKPRKLEIEDPGVRIKDAPYLGGIVKQEDGLAQILDVKALLPDEVRDMLFAEDRDHG